MKVTSLILLLLGGLLILAAGILIGRLSIPSGPDGTEPSAQTAGITAIPTADYTIPEMDVPGDAIPGLPPFPGMRRVEYRQVIIGDLLETEVEYVMEGTLEPAHDYYRQLFDSEGWRVADLHIFQGEWTFYVIQGEREALVELESRGPLIEVEIELTEPLPEEVSGITVEY